jgi:Zn-dependent protease
MDPSQTRWLPPTAPGGGYQTSTGPPAPAWPPSATPPMERPHSPARRLIGPLLVAGALLLKFGAKLKVLLLLVPKLKVLTTSASMLVSIGAYALIWGWRFAVGFVLLLFVHEMGHVLQAKREGIKTSAPMFIPFLGALIMLREREKDAAVEARIGLAGPILGAAGCLVPLGIYGSTGDPFWAALAFTGFFLNLFNLLPVLPLDGGRAMAALSPWMWVVGYGILVAATFAFPNPIMLIILLFGGLETWHRWRARKSPQAQAFHQVPARTRFAVAATYVGLAVALAAGMQASFVERDLDDARQGPSQPVQAG